MIFLRISLKQQMLQYELNYFINVFNKTLALEALKIENHEISKSLSLNAIQRKT